MPKSPRQIISLSLISLTAVAAFVVPMPRYEGLDILSKLSIPSDFYYWKSIDRSTDFNPADMRYNFISRVFAREYRSAYRERLTLLILDAGNFHNPKVCYGASGYKSVDLPRALYKLEDRTIEADAVFFEKPGSSFVIVYWIAIDKKRVDWTGQKFLQLWYSLSGRKKAGLMVRMDIPAKKASINDSIEISREFLSHLYRELPPEQRDYIFGK